MNIYRCRFVLICPENSIPVTYRLEIERPTMIRVEDIQAAIQTLKGRGFHEEAADVLFSLLGGHQVLKAHHHGVDIETVRG